MSQRNSSRPGWERNRGMVNRRAGMDNQSSNSAMEMIKIEDLALETQVFGFFVDCENFPPIPYNSEFVQGALATVCLYVTEEATWQAQPPLVNRALNASDQFFVLFRSNPFRAGLVSIPNASAEQFQATLQNVSVPALFPLDMSNYLRFTRAVYSSTFQPSGPRQIAGRSSIDSVGGGGARFHWLDNLVGMGGSSTTVTLTYQGSGNFPAGTEIQVSRWNKGNILNITDSISVGGLASLVLTFNQAAGTTPTMGSGTAAMPCTNDYYGYQVWYPSGGFLGVNIAFQGRCSCLGQIMMPDFINIPTYSSKVRPIAAKFRAEYNGSNLPGPQGNLAVMYGMNPNDWQNCYDAGLNAGSAYAYASHYQKVSDHEDWPNCEGVATFCGVRQENELTDMQQFWQVDLASGTITDEWFLLNETCDYRVVVINSLNTPNSDGTNPSGSGQGCQFKYYFYWGISYNTSLQSLPTEEPIDDLMWAWKTALVWRKHVPRAVKGDYYFSTNLLGSVRFPDKDTSDKAYGKDLVPVMVERGYGAVGSNATGYAGESAGYRRQASQLVPYGGQILEGR